MGRLSTTLRILKSHYGGGIDYCVASLSATHTIAPWDQCYAIVRSTSGYSLAYFRLRWTCCRIANSVDTFSDSISALGQLEAFPGPFGLDKEFAGLWSETGDWWFRSSDCFLAVQFQGQFKRWVWNYLERTENKLPILAFTNKMIQIVGRTLDVPD